MIEYSRKHRLLPFWPILNVPRRDVVVLLVSADPRTGSGLCDKSACLELYLALYLVEVMMSVPNHHIWKKGIPFVQEAWRVLYVSLYNYLDQTGNLHSEQDTSKRAGRVCHEQRV
jgi:hypothetical protein